MLPKSRMNSLTQCDTESCDGQQKSPEIQPSQEVKETQKERERERENQMAFENLKQFCTKKRKLGRGDHEPKCVKIEKEK